MAVILTVTDQLACAERDLCTKQEGGEADLPVMWSYPDLL
jgi:hypothetical protein